MQKFLRLAVPSLFLGIGSLTLMSNWNGPSGAAAGSPKEGGNTCANAYCHGGTPNSGSGDVTIDLPSDYEAGKTYEITVSVMDEVKTKRGFQAIALDGNNNAVGTFGAKAGTETARLNGTTYIQHDGSDFTGTFKFNWTAPSSNVGNITFYVAGNATNGNGKTSGDNVYTTSKVIGGTASILSAKEAEISIFPNPTSDFVTISTPENSQYDVTIFAANGAIVYQNNSIANNNQIDVTSWKNGIYHIQLSQLGTVVSEPIVVQH